jgi:hypothetical protein
VFQSNSPVRVVRELRRRKVFRAAGVYAVVAFVIVKVADIVFPALQLPGWTVTFVVAQERCRVQGQAEQGVCVQGAGYGRAGLARIRRSRTGAQPASGSRIETGTRVRRVERR